MFNLAALGVFIVAMLMFFGAVFANESGNGRESPKMILVGVVLTVIAALLVVFGR